MSIKILKPLFFLTIFSPLYGMKDLELRQRSDVIPDHSRMQPRWIDDSFIQDMMARHLLSELSFDTHNPTQYQEIKNSRGGGLESPIFETSKMGENLEHQVLQHSLTHSPIQNPDTIPGFIHRDGMTFPFVRPPDMSHDLEMEIIKQYMDRYDVEFLVGKFDSLREELQKNTSFIDRTNKYKLSRRLSFIARKFQQDPVIRSLLQTYSATRLEDACLHLDQLHSFLSRVSSISIDGYEVVLDNQRVAQIMRVAGQLIEHRRDYQAEKKRYPAATTGGQLLDQSPVLSRIAGILYRGTHPISPVSLSTVTDLTLTTPTQPTNISPDVDAKILHKLQQITANPLTDFDAYMQQVGDVIDDMQQKGDLIPAQQRNLLAHLMKRIVSDSHPTRQYQKRKDALLGTVRYLFEMYFGAWYMSDEQMMARFDQACATFDALSKFDLSAITAEQWMDVFGTIIADAPYDIATLSLLSWIQDIGTLAKTEKALELLPSHLQKAYKFVLSEHPELIARTAEGVPIKLSGTELTSLLRNAAEKVPGTASTVVANMRQFFTEFEFGKTLANNSTKLRRLYQGQSIYRINTKINDLMKKGYHYYLDSLHFDHIEVFDTHGMAKFVLNLDGTQNIAKTQQMLREARRIPI